MVHQVLFFSRGGNTRKLADAIAGELGVKAVDVKTAAIAPGDGVVFLGSGCYASKPDKAMINFIRRSDFAGRKVAVFGTSASGRGSEVRAMEEALKQKGVKVIGSFIVRGNGSGYCVGATRTRRTWQMRGNCVVKLQARLGRSDSLFGQSSAMSSVRSWLRGATRCRLSDRSLKYQGTLARMRSISSIVKALNVSVRALPAFATAKAIAEPVSSSMGPSTMVTRSNRPWVQYTETFPPNFSIAEIFARVRVTVSFTLRSP